MVELAGGPIASVVEYHASHFDRFKMVLIPEFIGFVCLGLMVHFGKSRKENSNSNNI